MGSNSFLFLFLGLLFITFKGTSLSFVQLNYHAMSRKKKDFDSKERSIDLVFLFNFLIFILWRCVKRHGMIIALYSVSPYSTTPIYRSPLFIGGDSIIYFLIIFFFFFL